MGVLLQEVVLDLPDVLHAEPVGQFDLFEGVGDELLLAGGAPGAGELVLVEDAELHGRSPRWRAWTPGGRRGNSSAVRWVCTLGMASSVGGPRG